MIDVKLSVSINLSGMRSYAGKVPIRVRSILEKWAIRYRTYVQRRFDSFSRGGGDWPPLKTPRKPVGRKRKDGGADRRFKKSHVSILRDTNTLFTAMAPVLQAPPGSVNIFEADTVEVGFGGTASHPGGPTIAQIATWHNEGAGNLPVRQIIVVPPQSIIDQMALDADKELNR